MHEIEGPATEGDPLTINALLMQDITRLTQERDDARFHANLSWCMAFILGIILILEHVL